MKKRTAFMLAPVMVLSVLAVGLAGEVAAGDEVEFVVPKVVAAKGIEDFVGQWFISHVVYEDGKVLSREEMIAEDDLVDTDVDITITEDSVLLFDMEEDDGEALITPEYVPEDGTLKISNGSDEQPVLKMNDNGMLSCFVRVSEEEQYTVYFTRK